MAEELPSVLFVSCTEYDPNNLIKLVIGELPSSTKDANGIECFPWHVDTKYYEADVRLCSLKQKVLSNHSFASSVQGLVIYFDSETVNALNLVNDWLIFLKEYEAEVKILICEECKENSKNGVSKIEVQEWCVKEGFELVELNPLVDEEWEAEQDFLETTGIRRVNQALEAHVWPNLAIKDRKDPTSMSGLWHGGRCKSTETDHENMIPSIEQDNIEPSPEDLLEGGNFSQLFGQLASLKEKATSMPNEERKQLAEKIVLAYWNAIGGDEDDILDC